MQPNNPVVGGNILLREAIRSPNYVAGVSGWTINKDGSAEFNNGTFRGVIIIGSPPAQGAQELGLTPTSTPPIPSVLLNFNADYTWFVANIEYINTTDFFFDALVFNSNFNVTETITGVYRTASGVQIQTLVEGSSPNTLNYGTSNYDTSPLLVTWRNASLALQTDATLALGTQIVTAGNNGIGAQSVTSGTDTTTSATFVNMTGTGSVTSFIFKKFYSSSLTQVRFDMSQGMFVTVQPSACQIAALCNGVDTVCCLLNFNVANAHQVLAGTGYLTGLAAGTYTVQARWRRSGGTGTFTRDINDWTSLTATEVSV